MRHRDECAFVARGCLLVATVLISLAACTGDTNAVGVAAPVQKKPGPAAPSATVSGGAPVTTMPGAAPGAASPEPGDTTPEAMWLHMVGSGPDQTAKVCGRGAHDAIATALCAQPSPSIAGLRELHSVLGVPETSPRPPSNGQAEDANQGANNGPIRLVGMTANSSSLVSRSVSALNPRVVIGVIPAQSGIEALRMFAIGFVRGEPFVELAGYDDAARRLNFYLLAFTPSCSGERCSPAELLGEQVEDGWQGYTLYQAEDLTNTPFDCLSCHQPDGANAPRRILMRELRNPWMHWMPQEPRGVACNDGDADAGVADAPPDQGQGRNQNANGAAYIRPNLSTIFMRAHAGEARYAGLDLATLAATPAGRQLEAFVDTFDGVIGGQSRGRGRAGAGEPNEFPSRDVLTEALCTDTRKAWNAYRVSLRASGRPVPFYLPDVLEPSQRDAAMNDYKAFLARQANLEEFEVVTRLMSPAATQAIGFQPDDGDSAEVVLQQMCIRCHNDSTDRSLTRSRFSAESLDQLTEEGAKRALERVSLPLDAPLRMPPRRFGELPQAALEQIRAYFAARMGAGSGP